MTIYEGEGILETIKKQKIFLELECYKTSITIDFDGIYAPVEGLSVM